MLPHFSACLCVPDTFLEMRGLLDEGCLVDTRNALNRYPQLNEAVNRVLQGETAASVSVRYGVPRTTLRRHVRRAAEMQQEGNSRAADSDFLRGYFD
ncbi:hypothetical protein BaRGS_00035409 [Batillaria attramentaria]|uniref:HTH psq-type domain-containing protein n=1 Tax=Batillaria attramentaria TaxID=370345 RepID=A0ABD0JEU4_9CAEN